MDTLEERQAQLDTLAEVVRGCTKCHLYRRRKHAVPGEGPADARIMFVGEAPGAREDEIGRPFVGPAGQLLEHLLASIGLTREDVFITNVIKSRPHENRDPLPEEIDACKPYLARQIRVIDPDVIVTLGRFAMERWLPDKKISKVHGQGFRYGRRLIVPMWHPAAALRRPEWHVELEQDFLRLPDLIEEAQSMRDILTEEPETPPPPPAQQSLL